MKCISCIFRLSKTAGLKKIALISVSALLCTACTKVMELSDETRLTGFVIKSVTPNEIRLGAPVIDRDTVKIPVLRGISLFPMSINAEPVFSSETDQAVPGSSFSSFDDIKFDLEDVQLNSFYLVAKSGITKPYYIKLDIEDQENQNDFKQFTITGHPQNSTIATKGFINPISRTITLYGFTAGFPLEISAEAVLSENAYIKGKQEHVDEKSLQLSFDKYGDNVTYSIEAENGDIREWKVFLKQAKESTGTETSDILSAVSLDAKKQSAEIKSGGYKITEIGVDAKAGKLIMAVSPMTKNINVEIVPKLTVRPNSQLIGYKNGESIFLENYSSTADFIILDSRTGYFKQWKFALVQGSVGDIHSFPFVYSSGRNYIQIDKNATVIDNIFKQIKLQVTRTGTSSSYWPLTVTANDIVCSEGTTINIGDLNFNNINDSAQFSLVSSLGNESIWKVSLIPPKTAGEADIDSVQIVRSSYLGLTSANILINKSTAEVFIDLKDKSVLPLRILPYLYISDGAEFTSFQNGNFMEFRTFADTVGVEISSRSGKLKTWKFRLLEKSQLQNSDFELWITSGTPTIDPVPGRGRGWATANNIMVKGTVPVDNGANGLAAELSTDIISLPKNLITSATLFLGYFDMSTITLDKPRNMTKFGIPFEANPVAFAIDVKYIPGDNYQQSRHVSGSGILAQYALDDLDGEDRGQIWAELIHWNGSGQLNYAGEPVAGVHVLARAEYVISATGWKRLQIPFEKKPEYEHYNPTHIVFVAASSIEGHLFRGAKGSKLTVDNFELIY
ncbi:MAG: PCMD domain-containing protein [Prevotellaceae bacterium]|nr:PCMD domain-containing protein [Prevotellaceae bacterium]